MKICACPDLRRDASQTVTVMLLLRRVLCSGALKPCHTLLLRCGLTTQTGLLVELTSRGFISQVTK